MIIDEIKTEIKEMDNQKLLDILLQYAMFYAFDADKVETYKLLKGEVFARLNGKETL